MLLFTFVLLMNHLFFVAQEALARALPWEVTAELVFLELPRLFVMTLPMGTLLGVLVATGRISADHEWTAMQAAGRGLGTLVRPALLFGLLMGLASFLVYTTLFPRANYATRQLRHEILSQTALAANIRPRVFHTELPGTVLFVSDIGPSQGGHRLQGVLLHRSHGPGGYRQLILARTGDLFPASDGSGAVEIELRDGVMHIYRPDDPDDYRIVPAFGVYQERLEPAPIFEALKRAAEEKVLFDLNLPELFAEARRAAALEEPVVRELRLRSAWREIHARFALPAAALLFALLGVPLGLTRARSGKAAGFAVATLVIVVYWVTYTFARDQGARGRIPIGLGVWAADGLILVWALLALGRARRGPQGELWMGRLYGAWAARRQRALLARVETGRSEDGPSPPHPARGGDRWVALVPRYISSMYGKVFLMAAAAIYVIYAVVELKNQLDRALANEQPLALALRYLGYASPGMATVVLPVSALVAAVVCFTLLARSGELTALLSSGISLWRAASPVLSWTVALCALFFLVQDRVAPVTNREAEAIKDQLAGRTPRTYGLAPGGRWTFGSEGRLYHYQLYDPLRSRFQGLSIFQVERENPRILSHRYALTADWDGSQWELGPGWLRTFEADGRVGRYERFGPGLRLALDPPENFGERERLIQAAADLPDQLSLAEIRRQLESLAASGYDTTRLEVAYYVRLAHPATPFVMVLLGLPFAFRIGRRGSLYGIGVALALVIVYWATFAVFRALGLEAMLPPLLAAWGPNVLYSLVGLYLFLHVRT